MTDRARKSTGNRYQPIVASLCRANGWPEPLAEQRLIEGRRFSCDLVWEAEKIVCEIQGGLWLKRSGHVGGKAQLDDYEKANLLQLLGYRVFMVSPQQVTSGVLADLLSRAFRAAA